MSEPQKKALLKKLEALSLDRADFLASAQDGFMEVARKAQDYLASAFFDEFIGMVEVKDGKIVTNTATIRRVAGSKVFAEYHRTWGQRFVDFIAKAFQKIVETATEYLGLLTGGKKKADPDLLLVSYGLKDGKLIGGSYLESLLLDTGPERAIKQAAVKAITSGQSLTDFKKSFNTLVKGGELAGVVESQFIRAGFDAFAGFDRDLNNKAADDLGLNWAVYSGGTMVTTRPFCRARVGKVFSRAEILGWQKLDWAGKKPNNNVFTDLGGFQCQHVLRWITDELAEQLKNEQ